MQQQNNRDCGYNTGLNRGLSEGMSNIYLKVTIEETSNSQKFDFLGLRNLPPGQIWEA